MAVIAQGVGPYPEDTVFRNDVLRTDEQMGVFGELSYDISDTVTATLGARYFDYEVDLAGSANSSFCNMGASDANAYGTNINDLYDGDQSIVWSYSGCGGHETFTADNLPDLKTTPTISGSLTRSTRLIRRKMTALSAR